MNEKRREWKLFSRIAEDYCDIAGWEYFCPVCGRPALRMTVNSAGMANGFFKCGNGHVWDKKGKIEKG